MQKPPFTKLAFEKISIYFFEKGLNAQQMQQQENCHTAVNGSYFGQDENGNFFPAGLRNQDGKDLQVIDPTDFSDENLNATLSLQQGSDQFHIFPQQRTGVSQSGRISVNAGPLVVGHGEVLPALRQERSHWQALHPRTLLAQESTHQRAFWIFEKPISLGELEAIIKQEHPHTLLNLD